jgi:uncharacterized membrane protein
VPSKRELIGGGPPSESLHWSEFQWNRISAFFVGVVATSIYFLMNSVIDASQIPSWAEKILAVLLMGFIWYGLSRSSWQEILKGIVGIALGSMLGIYVS